MRGPCRIAAGTPHHDWKATRYVPGRSNRYASSGTAFSAVRELGDEQRERLGVPGDPQGAGIHRALEIEPDRPTTVAALAVLDLVGGHLRESRRRLDSALQFDPDHRSALIELTFSAVVLGDTATAREATYRVGGDGLIALAEASAGHDGEARHQLGSILTGPLPDSLRIASAAVWAAALVQLGDLEPRADVGELLGPISQASLEW